MAFFKFLILLVALLCCIVPPNFGARVPVENLAEAPSETPCSGREHLIKKLDDPGIVSIAKFAVDEHNKISNDSLIFEKVIGGSYQVVSRAIQYDLFIDAVLNYGSRSYTASVLINFGGDKELSSFNRWIHIE
ncbi:hypothetical protein QQ045_014693 [Rhodiola kirilowii]